MSVQDATIEVNETIDAIIDATAAGDAGVISVFVGLCSIIACCFSPVNKWWESLEDITKLRINVVISILIGSWDTVFDWIVCIKWYTTGNPWWATGLLLSIVLSGIFPFIVSVQNQDGCLACVHCCGLGIFLGAGKMWGISDVKELDPAANEENPMSFFVFTRLSETCFEAMIAGGIQIYVASRNYLVHENLPTTLELLSIIASVLSIGYGFVTNLKLWSGLKPSGFEAFLAAIFVVTDFLFRVLSLSLFIIALGNSMKWILLPFTLGVYNIFFTYIIFKQATDAGIDFTEYEGCSRGMIFSLFFSLGCILSCMPGIIYWWLVLDAVRRNELPVLIHSWIDRRMEFIVRLIITSGGMITLYCSQEDSFTWIHWICVAFGVVSALYVNPIVSVAFRLAEL